MLVLLVLLSTQGRDRPRELTRGTLLVLCQAEIDLGTIALVQTTLNSMLSHGFEQLIVDLADVTFCSSRGLTLLVDAATSADHTTRYALSGASPQAERIWALLRPADQLPTRYPTAQVGVLAAMASRSVAISSLSIM